MSDYTFLNDQLSKRTSIFGLRLWVVLGICVGAAIVLVLFLISLWFTSRRNSSAASSSSSTSKPNDNNNNKSSQSLTIIPNVSKEIQEIRIDPDPNLKLSNPDPLPKSEPLPRPQQLLLLQQEEENPVSGRNRIHIEIGKDHRISYPERVTGSGHGNGETRYGEQDCGTGGLALGLGPLVHTERA